METLETPPAAPMTPLGARTPHAHPAFVPVIAVLAAAAAVGIYLAMAYLQGWWPLTRTPEPAASASVSPSPSGVPVLWRDITYGFVLNLPESWRGFTVEDEVLTANRTDGTGQTETFREFHFIHPKSTSKVPRQDIPVMVLTTAQWERIVREELSVGAAPIPPSELARNSKYVFALPARYNYAFYDGWEEVEAIMKTNPVSAYEPDSSAGPVDGPLTDGWLPFSSRYFTLSFRVPPGFVVTDRENSIFVSRGPLEEYTIGSDNTFMRLQRYVNAPKGQAEAEYRAGNHDVRASTITVDGSTFRRLDGVDSGSYEGDSAGRTTLVIFDRSTLYVEEWASMRADPPYDAISVADQILATFRFSK